MRTSSELHLGLRLSPQLVLTRELLALSTEDLALRIDAEVASNPALDWGNPSMSRVALPRASTTRPTDDSPDIFSERLAAPRSLADHLLDQLRLHLSATDMLIGAELIGSLDSRGWLAEDPAVIAERLGVPTSDVIRIIPILQNLDPAGIGARSLQEALLIQLDQLGPAQARRQQLARRLVADHLDDLGRQAWPRLARQLKVTVADIEAALGFIRANLTPYPAHTFWGDERQDMCPAPDVVIEMDAGAGPATWRILVMEEDRFALRLAPSVTQLAASYPEMDTFVERARLFLASLRQRWRTLKRIVTALVEAQVDFVRCGPDHRHALTQTEIARQLKIHESTISRTVRQKYAQLPNGRIVPLSAFFTTDAPAKTALRALIEAEPTPLTDQELCEALVHHGFVLSRRTVAKYRTELGIPSTHRRVARAR